MTDGKGAQLPSLNATWTPGSSTPGQNTPSISGHYTLAVTLEFAPLLAYTDDCFSDHLHLYLSTQNSAT